MTQEQQHLITPPSELLDEWCMDLTLINWQAVATQAAQWGADQELEACCKWLNGDKPYEQSHPKMLRAARRPKPPTRKERALKALDGLALPDDAFETICFALEALND